MSREGGFCLSKSWKRLMFFLNNHWKSPSQDSWVGFFIGPHSPVHWLHFPSTYQPWAFLSFTSLLCTISCSSYPFCLHIPTCMPSLPPSSFLCLLLQVTKAALFRAHSGYSSLVSYWFTLYLKKSQWEQTCWLVSSLLAHIAHGLFTRNLLCLACFMLISCLPYP
jgi:hypothetical protein